MRRVVGALGAVLIGLCGLLLWPSGAQGQEELPYTYDGTKLTGSWVLVTQTTATTCEKDYEGNRSSRIWTATFNDGQVNFKSSSGLTLRGGEPSLDGGSYRMKVASTNGRGLYDLKLYTPAKGKPMFQGVMASGDMTCVSMAYVTLTKE